MAAPAERRIDREATLDAVRRVLEARPEVLDGYVFGSVARGEAAAHSDVDVAVTVDPALVPSAPYGYAATLGTDLMAALGHSRVDVVVLNDAGPLVAHRVVRDGVRVVSRDPRATTTREGRILSRYFDWAVQLRKIDAVARARSERDEFGR